MGRRLRAVAVAVVLLAAGALAGSGLSQWGLLGPAAPAGDPQGAAPVGSTPDERVRVEVLNGGGRADMARHATDHLRARGFDVVYYGNADAFDHEVTVVLDRVARPELARAVAAALEADAIDLRSEGDSTRFVDVTVVLGASWNPPAQGAPAPRLEPAGRPAWWDLRRFLPEQDDAPPAGDAAGRMADPPNGGG